MARRKMQGSSKINDYPNIPSRLEPELYNAIKEIAARNHRSACAQIRFILEDYVTSNNF